MAAEEFHNTFDRRGGGTVPTRSHERTVFAPLRVLLVEDDADVRYLVRSAFDDDGRFEIVGEAGDGAEGVWLAGALEPNAIVLDLMMPGMDGGQALAALRERTSPSAIVILTALQSSQVPPETWLGADAFVEKTAFRSVPGIVASLCDAGRVS